MSAIEPLIISAPSSLSVQFFQLKTELCCLAIALEAAEGEFDESKVKRGPDGRFAKQSGSNSDSDNPKSSATDAIAKAISGMRDALGSVGDQLKQGIDKLNTEAQKQVTTLLSSKAMKDLDKQVRDLVGDFGAKAKAGYEAVRDAVNAAGDASKKAASAAIDAAKKVYEQIDTMTNGELSYAIGAAVGLAVFMIPYSLLAAFGVLSRQRLFIAIVGATTYKLLREGQNKELTKLNKKIEEGIKKLQAEREALKQEKAESQEAEQAQPA